ncbi:DUF2905 family protein [Psychrobacter sp. I-STPA10]|uniref:DUF2905 family protein n=1 Tax=Psychrobacter sp. I-STPA10 TaxID=2585769 RepID=UPI001E531640|nr:DUF2905 family protein [Psychrobacter sp. I-STPA10]
MAKLLIIIGLVLVVIGVVWMLFPSMFAWIGKLPGDIHYSSGNTQIYFPIVSMIIISIIGSILLNLFNR